MKQKEWMKVKIINCVEAPNIPGERPRQAVFIPDIPDCEAEVHTPTGNVWLRLNKYKRQMMIGVGNIKGLEVYWEEHGEIQDSQRERSEEAKETKRSPGRPPKIFHQVDP